MIEEFFTGRWVGIFFTSRVAKIPSSHFASTIPIHFSGSSTGGFGIAITSVVRLRALLALSEQLLSHVLWPFFSPSSHLLCSKLSDSAVGLATAQQALSEAQTRTEAIRDVEEEQQSLRDEVSTLRTQLEETRVTAVRQKLDAEQRLHQVRQEVNHYRVRIFYGAFLRI